MSKIDEKRIVLPAVTDSTLPAIHDILNNFNLPREVIASNDEIVNAWKELPRELARIPFELRDGLIARMCVAISVGLFDGAINYIWNAVILNLRERVKNFGLGYVAQTLSKKFEEEDLVDLKDSELLELCYKLELLSQEGYFFLNQCRDIRNNFSSAHPSIAQIDDRELINFISRCCKHGINLDYVLKGINVAEFINSVKNERFNEDTMFLWKTRLENTFPAQRTLLIPMLHGLYCDSSSKEYTRINALDICINTLLIFDSKIKSALIDQHNSYLIKAEDEKTIASRLFLQKLDLLNLLDKAEQHSIIKKATTNLLKIHLGFDNFYNEPPFAQNLLEVVASITVPDSAKDDYVNAVMTCYIGNIYGYSRSAMPFYVEMISNFSPKEIDIMLSIPSSTSIVANRLRSSSECRKRFLSALELIDKQSFSSSQLAKYERYHAKS